MNSRSVRWRWRSLPVLAFAALAGGCEVDGQGGNDDVQWKFTSNPNDPNAPRDTTAQAVYTDDHTTVKVAP